MNGDLMVFFWLFLASIGMTVAFNAYLARRARRKQGSPPSQSRLQQSIERLKSKSTQALARVRGLIFEEEQQRTKDTLLKDIRRIVREEINRAQAPKPPTKPAKKVAPRSPK